MVMLAVKWYHSYLLILLDAVIPLSSLSSNDLIKDSIYQIYTLYSNAWMCINSININVHTNIHRSWSWLTLNHTHMYTVSESDIRFFMSPSTQLHNHTNINVVSVSSL